MFPVLPIGVEHPLDTAELFAAVTQQFNATTSMGGSPQFVDNHDIDLARADVRKQRL